MSAYLAGAMFASTEYNLFLYFMVGYICAIYYIASVPQGAKSNQQDDVKSGRNKKLGDTAKGELAWTR
jgi:hypothetical protein